MVQKQYPPYTSAVIGTEPLPECGFAQLDSALSTFFEGVTLLQAAGGDAIYDQGIKLQEAAENYMGTEKYLTDTMANVFSSADGRSQGAPDPPPAPNAPKDYYPMQTLPLPSPPVITAQGIGPSAYGPRQAPETASPNLLNCDEGGLLALASQLCSFVNTVGNPTVQKLNADVNQIVVNDPSPASEGGYGAVTGHQGLWMGPAAAAFYNQFISNAAIMNGFHRVLCEAAKTIQTYADYMSAEEYRLDIAISEAGLEIYPQFDISMVARSSTTDELFVYQMPQVQGQPGSASLDITNNLQVGLNQVFQPYYQQAMTESQRVAAALTVFSEVFKDAAKFYYHTSYKQVQTKQSSILQLWDWKPFTKRYNKFMSSLTPQNSVAKNATAQDLTDVGIAAKDAATLIGDVQNIIKAQGTVAVGEGVLDTLGDALPVLAEWGYLLLAA